MHDTHVEVGKCQDVGVEMSKEFAASSLLYPIILYSLVCYCLEVVCSEARFYILWFSQMGPN
jgi:hypothetical protein